MYAFAYTPSSKALCCGFVSTLFTRAYRFVDRPDPFLNVFIIQDIALFFTCTFNVL